MPEKLPRVEDVDFPGGWKWTGLDVLFAGAICLILLSLGVNFLGGNVTIPPETQRILFLLGILLIAVWAVTVIVAYFRPGRPPT